MSILRKNDNTILMSKNNDPNFIYINTTDSFIDLNLNVNTIYTYTITLYNNYNKYGIATILNDVSFVTLPNLTNIPVFGTITTNSINIQSIVGNFYYCKITRNTGEIYTIQKTDTSFNNTGLIVNTSYSYTLTPYNINDFSGSSITIGPIFTLPNITDASYRTITSNSITINSIPGYYNKINIYRNSISNKIGSIIPENGFTDVNLNPNSLYNYILIPFNIDNKQGNSFYLNPIYTYASGTINPCNNITSSQIQINWTGYYSSVNIIRKDGTSTITNINDMNSISLNTNGNVIDTGLNPDYLYYYTVNLINGNGISTNIANNNIYGRTLGKIVELSYRNITTNSIELYKQNVSDISFTKLLIDRIVGNVTYYQALQILYSNLNTTDSQLTPNTQYSYDITPYNLENIPNPSSKITIGPICTLPIIGSFSFGKVTINSIVLNVTGSYFNRIDISYNGTNIGNITYPNTSFIHKDLISDTNYNYSLTPFNISGNTGLSVITGSKCTLPKINSAEINNITYNSTRLSITDAKFHRIDISYNGIKIGSINYLDNSFNHTGLKPNTNYIYNLTPYNIENINGSTYTVGTFQTYTKSTGSIVDIINTSNGVKISWSGTYYKAYVTRNQGEIMISNMYYLNYPISNNSTIDVSGYIIDTNVFSNSNYVYTLVLYNNMEESTVISNSISIYSIPVVNSNYGNITNNSIEFFFNGSYNKINILRRGGFQSYSFDLSNTIQRYIDNSGLSYDTSYNYTITPIASDNTTIGTSINLGLKYTLGNITSASYGTITQNSININNIIGTYYYITVNRLTDSQIFTINYPDTSGTDQFSLTPDTSYNYSLTSYNHDNSPGNIYLLPVKYTLASITSASFGNITNKSIEIFLSGKYTSVNVSRISNVTTFFKTLNRQENTLIDNSNNSDLPANTSFSYSFIPFNYENQPNSSFTIGPRYTYSFGNINPFTNITKNQIQINWNGIYSNINVVRKNGSIQPDTSSNYMISTSPQQNVTGFVVDKNLNINTTYSYSVYMYNSNNVQSIISLDISATTLPNIGTVIYNSYTTNSINFSITDGSYNTVSIKRIDENGIEYNFSSSGYSITDTTSILPNKLYRYQLTPYNIINASGSVVQLGNVCTLPIIRNVQKQQTANNKIQFTIDGSYNSFEFYFNNVLTYTGYTSIYEYTITSLSSNSLYTFGFIPYNKGSNITRGDLYQLNPSYLDAYVNASYVSSSTTSNSISINITGNYYYILLTKVGSNNSYNYYNSPILHKEEYLNPNQPYNFTVTPYNNSNSPGTTITLGNIYTLPIISGAIYGNINNNSIEIKNIIGSYGYLKLNRTSDGTNFVRIPAVENIITSYYNDNSGLNPNTKYYYTITPYNNDNILGVDFTTIKNTNLFNITSSYIYTLAKGLIQPCSDISYNQLKINWNGIYNNAVVIRNNGFLQPSDSFNYNSSQYPQTTVNGYVFDTFLNPNTLYSYTVTINNTDGIGNVLSNDISAVTLSLIDSVLLQSTYNTVSLNNISARNGYNKVVVYRTGGSLVDKSFNIITPNTSETDTLLNSNRLYNYSLVPYNSNNVAGPIYTGNIYTLSNISLVNVTNIVYNDLSINITRTDLSYITVNTLLNGVSNTNIYSNNYLTTSSGSIDCSNLLSNSNYTITVVPYNNVNINGTPVTINAWTLSNVYNIIFTNNVYSIGLNLSTTDLSYVSISKNGGNPTNNLYSTINSILYDNLIPNYNYIFIVKPYNNIGNVGSTYTGSTYTLSDLSNLIVTTTDNTYEVDISFTYTDLSYISILTSTNTTAVTNNYSKNNISLPIKNSGLIPNTNYTFTVIPYNNQNNAGTTQIINTNTRNELSLLTLMLNVYDISISFNCALDVSYVIINRTTGTNNITNRYQTNMLKDITINQSGLIPDMSYVFMITPYSNTNTSYNKYYFNGLSSYLKTPVSDTPTTYPIYTLSDISNIVVTSTNLAYEIDISFTYTDLSYILFSIIDI